MQLRFEKLTPDNFRIWFDMNDDMSQLLDGEKLGEEIYQKLLTDAFRDNPPFYGEIVHDENGIVGFMTWKKDYSTWTAKPVMFLEDIYVKPELRGKGFGTKIFQRCLEIAKELKCSRFEWWTGTDNKKAQSFYTKMGATKMDKYIYRMTEEKINQL
jgi:GNAT superfamily N-acetyltransferase